MEKISLAALRKKVKNEKGLEIKKSGICWHLINIDEKTEIALHYRFNYYEEYDVLEYVLNETLYKSR